MRTRQWVWVAAVSLWTMPALAAADYYIKLGGVEGESKDRKQTIEVLSWSWGLSKGGTAGSSKRVGAGTVQAPTATPDASVAEPQPDAVNEVTLRIRESPTLPSQARQGCTGGTHFGTVDLGGKGKRYQMHDAIVTACEVQDGVRTMKLKGHVTLIK